MIRLLVVDDSAFARCTILRSVSSCPEIQIVGFARDGIEAMAQVRDLKPDVITLDVEMPRMNGLETLEAIMAEEPTPVVMASSLTGRGTDTTLRALEIGAVDYFLKASTANPGGDCGSQSELVTKIILAANVKKAVLKRCLVKPQSPPPAKRTIPSYAAPPRKVVVIASSTGGPGTLYKIIPQLPGDLPAAVVVIQHMPAVFTKCLAGRLDELSFLSVREAAPGMLLTEGQVLIAPGGYHMVVGIGDKVSVNKDAQVLGLRPAADITMPTIARWYQKSTVGVVLTGMGSDGTNGAAAIKAAGGKVIAQDEASCVVYGMPRSVFESGFVDKVVPLAQMAEVIVEMCRN